MFFSISSNSSTLSSVEITVPTPEALSSAFSSITEVSLVDTSITLFNVYEKTLIGVIQGDLLVQIGTGLTTAWSSAGKSTLSKKLFKTSLVAIAKCLN